MATNALEMSFFEKVGEKFSNFPDAVMKAMTKLLGGSSSDRFVKKLGFIPSKDPEKPHTVLPGSIVARVNDAEPGSDRTAAD